MTARADIAHTASNTVTVAFLLGRNATMRLGVVTDNDKGEIVHPSAIAVSAVAAGEQGKRTKKAGVFHDGGCCCCRLCSVVADEYI